MFRRFGVWTLFSNAASAPFVLRNSSSVSDSVTPKILGHVPGHVFVDSKGLVPESRNSHIVLRLCVLRFSRIRFFPRRNRAVHKTFASTDFGFCSQRLVT